MKNCLHLLVAITPHGYGHAAQIAPIVNALRQKHQFRLTIATSLPVDFLKSHFEGSFELVAGAADFGMVMSSSIDVKIEESARAYQLLHQHWHKHLNYEAVRLGKIKPDFILANIPYLTLAAANKLGIPAYGISSLNWADIYWHYCHSYPEAAQITEEMRSAYNSAKAFLKVEPCMPMLWLNRSERIGVVARIGQDKRREINTAASLTGNEQLIVVGFGGIAMRLPVETWPQSKELRWIVPAEWKIHHPYAIPFEDLGVSFIDLVRSCDALITKPGYGAFTEAACNNVPVLYVERRDWPEEPHLVSWLKSNARTIEINRIQLEQGAFITQLQSLQTMISLKAPTVDGPSRAVYWFEEHIQNFH